MKTTQRSLIPIGYEALVQDLSLRVMPHYRASYVAKTGKSSVRIDGYYETHVYSKHYQLKQPNALNQLEFALKYDGINLEIITAAFQQIPIANLIEHISASPTGKYARLIWFLYEWLTDKQLPIDDVRRGNYVVLLDESLYYTGLEKRSKRHRVVVNLLGNKDFCPIVRKTEVLKGYDEMALDQKANDLIESYDPKIMARASQYFFTKETISSYKIEREVPSKKREERYVELLSAAHRYKQLTKSHLIELQQATVEERFVNYDYRTTQNYVGETINPYLQKIHYIAPTPDDVESLMAGMLDSLMDMMSAKTQPVVMAAAIAFGFVFIHPFDDGNGRLHRFLIHYVLSKMGFTPKGIIFPVSAVMVDNMAAYDAILESFSQPLMTFIQYEQFPDGEIQTNDETHGFYRYVDYTRFAEYLFTCVEKTVLHDFQHELDFLVNYDTARKAVQSIVDLPDRLLDLLIKCIYQNQGVLSKSKRKQYFDMLTDAEVLAMQIAVCEAMQIELPAS